MNGEESVDITIIDALHFPTMDEPGLCRDLLICIRRNRAHLVVKYEVETQEDTLVDFIAIGMLPPGICSEVQRIMNLGIQVRATLWDSNREHRKIEISLWVDPDDLSLALALQNTVDFNEYQVFQKQIERMEFRRELDTPPALKISQS